MARARRSASLNVAADWSAGMVKDAPRTALPENAVFDAQDFLLHRPGIMQKRGGTMYAGPALTATTVCQNVGFADFSGGGELVAMGANGHLFRVTSGTTSDIGLSSNYARDKWKFISNKLILTNYDGISAPQYYDGTAITTLGGTPPPGKYAEVYKTRLLLANTLTYPNRIFFSPTPNIESAWNTADSWIDCDYPVTGIAALSNQLLIWSLGHMERIIGSTPPPGSDMDHTVISATGCTDARSIVVYNNQAIFANPRGVYITNGAGTQLLTKDRIEKYWQDLFSGYDLLTWTIAGGLYGSYYLISVSSATATIATLMLDIDRRTWTRHTNIRASSFARSSSSGEELWYGDFGSPRVVKMSPIFVPSASNKNDADGTAVAPRVQLRLVGDSPGLKHHGFGHVTLDMRDAASDNPTMQVSVAPGVEATTYQAAVGSPLTETLDAERRRFTVGKVSQAVNVYLQQQGASERTEVYAVEVETRPLPVGAGGQ